jgi:ABC-type sugar transport system ATPase subunit
MADVRYSDVTCRYDGGAPPALSRLDLHAADGELVVLVGPSGSGKTTALRALAGLEPVSSGQIFIGERDVTQIDPKDRDVAMVFQSYALYPHMSVAENMGFALKQKHVSAAERARRVKDAARLLELEPLLGRRPGQLSGGQRQRVAMGRAIVREPRAFLMDEPLSNLDAKLRVQTRAQIAALQRRLRATMIYVTHDQVEAMTLGDRVAVLHDGQLQQCAPPRELYEAPTNIFVAGFVGSPAMNLLILPVDDGHTVLGELRLPVPPPVLEEASKLGDGSVVLGLRADAVSVGGDAVGPRLRGIVTLVEDLGMERFAHVRIGAPATSSAGDDGEERSVISRLDAAVNLRRDEAVDVVVHCRAAHWFSPSTGVRLGSGTPGTGLPSTPAVGAEAR